MFLSKVIVGEGKILKTNSPLLTAPPDNCDSVLGEADPNGNLLFDEVVVYRDEAVIPAFIIIYRCA
jgi:hypothetical protein